MLRFNVYDDGKPTTDIDLGGAYVFGQEAIPVRADLVAADGQIICSKRVPGACGLAMMWQTGSAGRFLLPTTRLPERSKPYNLNVELARAQMMRIAQKREESNHDLRSVDTTAHGMEPVFRQTDRQIFFKFRYLVRA